MGILDPLSALQLLRTLTLRLLLGSFAVKCHGGDIAWKSLQAGALHLHTQPLPTDMARRLFLHLPEMVLKVCTLGVLLLEGGVCWLVLAPWSSLRLAASGCLVLFTATLFMIGHYGILIPALGVLALSVADVGDILLTKKHSSGVRW